MQQQAGGDGAANGETLLQIGISKICTPGGQELLETVAKGECEQGKKGGNKRGLRCKECRRVRAVGEVRPR